VLHVISRIDPSRHDLTAFRCGQPGTDSWLRLEASAANLEPGWVVCVAGREGRVVGCYRVGAFALQSPWATTADPGDWTWMPALLVSRVGVDQRWQGRGLGTSLLWHALELAARLAPGIAVRLVLARADSPAAAGLVSRLGFHALAGDRRFGWLSIQDVLATTSAVTTQQATRSRDPADLPR
jgi:GNAT superfamily N-acetyltransferase